MQHRWKTIIILTTIWAKFYCLRFSFLNEFEIENSMSLWLNFIKILCGQYRSNSIVRIVSWLEFARKISKFNIDRTIYNVNKHWSKFTKWTIWICPYSPWLKFFKNISSSKKSFRWKFLKDPLKDNMFQTVFYLDLSFLYVLLTKINQCFLHGRYGSNDIVRDSNCLKTFETEEKGWTFNEKLIESLKRKITVKP